MTPKASPTQAELAAALNLSTRRIRQLISDGMPSDSIEAAKQWRKDESSSGSAEELRRARIALVNAQKERVEIENARLRGEFIPAAQVKDDAMRMYSIARAEFMRLSSEAPPRICGLSEPKCQAVLREMIYQILSGLADGTAPAYEDHPEIKK